MAWTRIILAVFILYLQAPVQSSATPYGKDFYIGFMRNLGDFNLASQRLSIGTAAEGADYVVESNFEVIQQGTVSSGAPVTVDIPTEIINLEVTASDFDNREKGIRVYTTNNETIYVLVENFITSINYGVYLAYPSLSIDSGTLYEYYIISTESSGNFHSQFLLVGCEDNTIISVTPTQSVQLPQDPQTAASTVVTIESGAVSQNFSLNQMQTLLVTSALDLTGTKIVSNKPLSVISGHECANVPSTSSGCEPLAVNVPPSNAWGTSFLLAPFAGRDTASIYRLISAEETSIIYTCGSVSRGSEGATSLLFSTTEYCSLRSSKTLLVVQLAAGSSIDNRGDPAIAMVSPIDQYANETTFITLPSSTFSLNYIGITVSAEHYTPSNILLDGAPIDCEWVAIQNITKGIVGYGCSKVVTSGSNSPVQHTVSHSDGLISVLVYGFNAASPSVGYAYLAGKRISTGANDVQEVIIEASESLPFVDLTGFPGAMELDNSVADATSEPIYIPRGLIFGDQLVTSAYVNENGVISFQNPWRFSFPDLFPTQYFWTREALAVAPFWSDNDIRKEGTVRYATYCTYSVCTTGTEGQTLLDNVNQYIQSQQGDSETEFEGQWLLVAHWDHVHPSPHGSEDQQGYSEEQLNMVNDYQTIIVSDVLRTYVIFSYICGGMQWSALGRNRAAVVGFNAEGNVFDNHRSSGFDTIGDAVSCTIELGKRRKRENDGMNTTTNMQMKLPTDQELEYLIGNCTNINDNVITAYLIVSGQNITELANMLEPCPCTRNQANLDTARFRPQVDMSDCFVSSCPLEVESQAEDFNLTQQCCYNNGALVKSSNEGYAGTMLLQHPNLKPDMYMSGDKALRGFCCDDRLQNQSVNYCNTEFFSRRVINTCAGYNPPAVGIGDGDPHYKTFDETYFNFQGNGDFTLLNIKPEGSHGPIFSLQGRLARTSSNAGATWHTEIAFGQQNAAFELGMIPGLRVFQTKPGPVTEITAELQDGQPWMDATGETELIKNGNSLDANFFKSGVTLTVLVYRLYEFNALNYQVRVPRSFSLRTFGIFGNLDGDASNEFYRRGETNPLPNGISESNLYNHLLTWETTSSESLFSNPTRRKRQLSEDDIFMPVLFDELNFTDSQIMICEGNEQCLFDLAVTGDTELAMTTLDHQRDANATIEVLENFPPNISAEAIFRVNLGLESFLILNVIDPGDEFTMSVQGGLPDNSVLDNTGDGEYFFRWNLQQITTEPLVFIANDTRGAAATFTPTVEVCACANGGLCTLDGVQSSSSTIVMNCLCNEAFDGAFCEGDRNGCSEIQCFEGVACMDVPAPGVGAMCGSCPPGYTGDSLKCYDIDECSLNDTLCEQLCSNTDGSYFCSCQEGYRLIEGTSQCQDINECVEVNDCQQLCQNTIGSYECSCSEGFTLLEDGRTCTANEPCGGECSFNCAVINGEEQCFCPVGLELSMPGGTQCIDRDECLNNPCEQTCANTEGSFECSCMDGYELQEDGKICEDIDECFEAALEGINVCEGDQNSQCVNTEGSFECVCVPGYIRNDGTCERIEIPPPMVLSVMLTSSTENSVNFTSPTLTLETFTPGQQQMFRVVAAAAIVDYCSIVVCELILSDEESQSITELMIDSANIAIPTSLILENEEGQLLFTLYVQVGDGFLSREQLEPALLQAEEQFRDAGFLTPHLAIAEDPQSQLDVEQGADVTFSRNGGQILDSADNYSGLSTNELTVLSVDGDDEGFYSVIVLDTDRGALLFSNAAELSITKAPVIDVQPEAQLDVPQGTGASFSVTATGQSLSYQWQKDEEDIAGETRSLLTILSVESDDEGMYRVIVTNPAGNVISNSVSLTVLLPPVIIIQPTDAEVAPGDTVSFTVVSAGDSLSYQWFKDGVALIETPPVFGSNSDTILMVDVTESNDGEVYYVMISNDAGVVMSDQVTLTVVDPPHIDTQPSSLSDQIPGDNVTFGVMATGKGLSYQWQKDGEMLSNNGKYSGTTTAVLTINDLVFPDDEGSFNVMVSNEAGFVISSSAELTIVEPVQITDQPESITIAAGEDVTFTVVAVGDSLSYQWQKDGVDIADSATSYAGSNTATLTVLSVADSEDEGMYRVRVSNIATQNVVFSDSASLTILTFPSIANQPESQLAVAPGSNVTFTVEVNGDDLIYHWQKDDIAISDLEDTYSGTQTAQLTVLSALESDEGSYHIIVANSIGIVTSNDVTLKIVECPPLAIPLNSEIIYSQTSFRDEDYAVGTEAMYNCSEGDLFGNNVRTCQIDGTWSGEEPVCADYCPPLPLSDGSIAFSSNASDSGNFQSGTIATHQCAERFGLSGENTRMCIGSDESGQGSWSGEVLTCDLIMCFDLPDPDNGDITFTLDTTSTFDVATTATYSCDLGYVLTGGDEMRTCVGTSDDPAGYWDGVAPTCEQIMCAPLPLPENAELIIYSTEPDSTDYVFGTMAVYVCSDGFGIVTGDEIRTCSEGGVWSGMEPTCAEPVSVGFVEPLYAITEGENVEVCFEVFSGTVFFRITIRLHIRLHINSVLLEVWTELTVMHRTCAILSLDSLDDEEDTGDNSYLITAELASEYPSVILHPDAAILVVNDDDIVPRCPDLLEPNNGRIKFAEDMIAPFEVGTIATYSCGPGFALDGGDAMRVCESNGSGRVGAWSGIAPSCIAVIFCPDLGVLANGVIVYAVDTEPGFEFGTTATYKCIEGFGLSGGDAVRTCGCDGDDDAIGQWSGEAPSCEPILCPDIADPVNGQIDFANDRSAPFDFNTTATYSCYDEFTLSDGSPVRICGGDDSSNVGVWSGEELSCLPSGNNFVSPGFLLGGPSGLQSAQDISVEFSMSSYVINEGDSESVCIKVSGQLDKELVVDVSTVADEAQGSGEDYSDFSEELTFTKSPDQKCISLLTSEDNIYEKDEEFSVSLSYSQTSKSSSIIIEDNDQAILSLSVDESVCEGASSLRVCIQLQSDIEKVVEAVVETKDLSAKEPDDYKKYTNTFIFSSSHTELCGTITIVDDGELEPCEEFGISLSSSSERAVINGLTPLSVQINDDEGSPPLGSYDGLWYVPVASNRKTNQDFIISIQPYCGQSSPEFESRPFRTDNIQCGVHFTDQQYEIDSDAGSVTFEWEGTGPNQQNQVNQFVCSLDGGQYYSCSSPHTLQLQDLSAGDHTISVDPLHVEGCFRAIARSIMFNISN